MEPHFETRYQGSHVCAGDPAFVRRGGSSVSVVPVRGGSRCLAPHSTCSLRVVARLFSKYPLSGSSTALGMARTFQGVTET